MPTILTLDANTARDVINAAIEETRAASDEVKRLTHEALNPEESLEARLKLIARASSRFVQAFEIMDALLIEASRQLREQHEDSPASSSSDDRPGSQGCAPQGGDPTTN